jgi:deoxyribodipyrimidine photolyase-related protein
VTRATTVVILADQLLDRHPALDAHPDARVLLVESAARLQARPWHRQKQVLVLSALRHYAERLRGRGIPVDRRRAATITDGVRAHLAEHPGTTLVTMAAAEYAARQMQMRWAERLGVPVTVLPNTQFLVGQHDPFPGTNKRVIMETFYRALRRHFRVLMDGDQPAGGAWNFDHDNRKPLPRTIDPPPAPHFPPDTITRAAIAEVETSGHGYGSAADFAYGVTHEDARAALDDFIARRLVDFGAYEDAMTARHRTIFHSVLSPYLNLGLLTPLEAIAAAERAYRVGQAPINSVEGFIRQIIGWREYMYWQYWRMMPELAERNAWEARRDLPAFFWTGRTRMACVGHAVRGALETAYLHHIQRLMVISNFCLMAGIEPRQVVDWFMALFIDAYDWVMQPNTIGMGLNADGGQTATKPYIASANYIHKMSDYCGGCPYDHRARTGQRACPFNLLYWNFLIQHEAALRANPRFGQAVLGLRYLSADERAAVTEEAARWLGRVWEAGTDDPDAGTDE